MTLPTIPATVDQAAYWRIDLLIRSEYETRAAADGAALAAWRARDIAFREAAALAEERRTKALEEQAAALRENTAAVAAALTTPEPKSPLTLAELTRWYTAQMSANWGRGAQPMTRADDLCAAAPAEDTDDPYGSDDVTWRIPVWARCRFPFARPTPLLIDQLDAIEQMLAPLSDRRARRAAHTPQIDLPETTP